MESIEPPAVLDFEGGGGGEGGSGAFPFQTGNRCGTQLPRLDYSRWTRISVYNSLQEEHTGESLYYVLHFLVACSSSVHSTTYTIFRFLHFTVIKLLVLLNREIHSVQYTSNVFHFLLKRKLVRFPGLTEFSVHPEDCTALPT